MPTCNRCGAHVSADFTRVFGDNDDEVYGCQNCVGYNAILAGAAAASNLVTPLSRGRSLDRRDGEEDSEQPGD